MTFIHPFITYISEIRDNKRSACCFLGNKEITSANGAYYTSLGQRPRIRAGQK
jgi:hypothetical protein